MQNYHNLMLDILENGDIMSNRTGTHTISVVSRELRWDLSKGFPLITTKKMATKAIVGELLFFLSKSDDISVLRKYTELSDDAFCIWQKNLDQYNARLKEAGIESEKPDSMGYIYSRVWRDKLCWDEVNGEPVHQDQIVQLIDDILAVKADPTKSAARRMIVDSWDAYAHTTDHGYDCALPPCHYGFQCFVRNGKLSLKWIQRSVN